MALGTKKRTRTSLLIGLIVTKMISGSKDGKSGSKRLQEGGGWKKERVKLINRKV